MNKKTKIGWGAARKAQKGDTIVNKDSESDIE